MRPAYLAVESRHGPHVTPHQFACGPDHVWLAASRKSLKVRTIRRRPAVGLLVRDGKGSVLIGGAARVLSPLDPRAAGPLAAYAQQNAPAMLGYALDLAALPEGASPADRVLVDVRVDRRLRFDHAPMADPVVVGWSGPDGPLALPASWDGTRARIPSEVIDRAGAPPASAACVVHDRSEGIRPSLFSGALLRGNAVLIQRGDGWTEVDLRVERVTSWDGFAARTAVQSLVGSS